MDRIREILKFAGKGNEPVAAVFAADAESGARAVAYLERELTGIPVWLFCAEAGEDSLALAVEASKRLWPRRVVLCCAAWTGTHLRWPVKLAAFFVPPFRVLIMNRQGDFFAATPGAVGRHVARAWRDAAHAGWNRVKDVWRGAWLWAFAAVAQRFAWLSRWAFRRAHGAGRLEVAAEACGEGVEVFEYSGRQWDFPALLTLLERYAARWVLFSDTAARRHGDSATRRRGDTATRGHGDTATRRLGDTAMQRLGDAATQRLGDAATQQLGDTATQRLGNAATQRLGDAATQRHLDSAIALPSALEGAFAVAWQEAYRDWKPGMFAMAPFRRLQAGEVSRVLAPVSGAMLVDRAKLLALGVPRTVVPGSAWLILFWKAAAAGWPSYAVGQEGEIAELADWPYEEAEFVSRVLADPALRALGPRDEALTRGNICWSPGDARKGARPRVIVVSPYLPYPLAHGGAVRIYNLCRALRDRVSFTLVCFREKTDRVEYEKLHEVFDQVYVVDRDERARKDAALPAQVREHQSASMRALIAELARDADLLQVEFTHMAEFRDAAPQLPAIYVEHDLTFTLFRQYQAKAEYEKWLRFERHWFGKFDATWVMSAADCAEAVAEGCACTRVIANGVDLERFTPREEATASPEIFYVGSFRHKPNVMGFERMKDEVMPLVWRRVPEAKLRVVAGPEPEKYWQGATDARVVMHGFVEDLRPLYAKAAVVAVPLIVSAGTNIKVMEAMACGKAVVSTPAGVNGLELEDGVDAVVRNTSEELAEAIVELLGDEARRRAISARARLTVERRFSWNAIADEAWASYREVLGR